jgi:indolepyruvate ferredoxin oxidoreductase
MWYGKGPGVDRAGDALKHGNAYGSRRTAACWWWPATTTAASPRRCRTRATRLPGLAHAGAVAPGNVAEYLEFGLYGWALSRYSGNWVGLAALSEVVESGATVDLDRVIARAPPPGPTPTPCAPPPATSRRPTACTTAGPTCPALRIETRLRDKLAAVAAFSRVNSIDREHHRVAAGALWASSPPARRTST